MYELIRTHYDPTRYGYAFEPEIRLGRSLIETVKDLTCKLRSTVRPFSRLAQNGLPSIEHHQ